ncbi:hypothetical protein [Campylobacter hyointestinalis]|nr:hypothetical protein [Campylobacter hyointestinalis]
MKFINKRDTKSFLAVSSLFWTKILSLHTTTNQTHRKSEKTGNR